MQPSLLSQQTTTHSLPKVLVVGDIEHLEFTEVRRVLDESSQWGNCAASEVTRIDGGNRYDWVVFAQSRILELPRDLLGTVKRRFPVASLLSLLGSCCEGELRTGKPWEGVLRKYWYEFPGWWLAQWEKEVPSRKISSPLVAIAGNGWESTHVLGDFCAANGWAATEYRATDRLGAIGFRIGIWNGGMLTGQEAARLARFCREMRNERAGVIALLDFPRVDRVELARKLGVQVVLGKPWNMLELKSAIQAMMQRTLLKTGTSIRSA